MCIMEIHDGAHRNTMIQAIAHNLSTIDRDLDMLVKVGESRNDHDLHEFAESLQKRVHAAYAQALTEFGISLANHASDENGHIHVGSERNVVELLNNATKRAKVDETR